eukprot:9290565-Karenia_brevis.AAC.1
MASHSSRGADGWAVVELKRLPVALLDLLAEMLNIVEANGRWPRQLTTAMITLITKGEGSRPDKLRPISVMSAVYRLWAARRLEDLLKWQLLWSPDCQHSYKKGHAAED